jgi:hypothetical protein
MSFHLRDAEDELSSSKVGDVTNNLLVMVTDTQLELDGFYNSYIANLAVVGTNTSRVS